MLAVFDIRPLWAPSRNGRQVSTLMLLSAKNLVWFERRRFTPRRFETCPAWGGNSRVWRFPPIPNPPPGVPTPPQLPTRQVKLPIFRGQSAAFPGAVREYKIQKFAFFPCGLTLEQGVRIVRQFQELAAVVELALVTVTSRCACRTQTSHGYTEQRESAGARWSALAALDSSTTLHPQQEALGRSPRGEPFWQP